MCLYARAQFYIFRLNETTLLKMNKRHIEKIKLTSLGRSSILFRIRCYITHCLDTPLFEKKEIKKEISLPLPNVTINKLLIEVSECDYIRKMLNKNHMSKVPSKTAKC